LFRVGVSGNGMDPVTERELMFQNRAIPVWDGSGDFQGRLTYDEGFVLDNSGHLGIGVNDFNNIKKANLFIEDSEPLLVIYSNTENDVGIELIRGANRLFGQDGFTDWRIRSSSGQLFIQSGFGGDPVKDIIQFSSFDLGRLGIGGITPSEALDVNGVSNFRDDILLNCSNVVDVSNILFCDSSDYNTTISRIDTSLNDHETRIGVNEGDITRIDTSLVDLSNEVTRLDNGQIYQFSTGLYEGGIISRNFMDFTRFDITPGIGMISDGNNINTIVEWNNFNGVSVNDISATSFTHVYIDVNGDIFQVQDVSPTPEIRRQFIYLGKLIHDGATITVAFPNPEMIRDGLQNFYA